MQNFIKTDKLVAQLVKELKIPYFEIIACKNGEEIFHKTIKPDEMADKNKLYMFSCTKPLTAVCAMRLIEEGRLSLEDPLIKYIPAFKDSYYLNENGEKVVAGHLITIRHLMTMSAGLDYNLRTDAINALHRNGNMPTTLEIAEAIAKSPLLFAPGERFQYSLCLDVVGAVIEVVTGMRYSEYAEKNVFLPLGMKNSSFRDEDKENFLPLNIANGKNITQILLSNCLVKSTNFDSGGAGLVSTLEDFSKFGVALAQNGTYTNGYKLLSKESIEKMTNVEVDHLEVNNNFTCVQGEDYSYGLGVRTRIRSTEWGLCEREFGWDGAAGSYLLVDTNKNISIVMGMHVMDWPQVFKGRYLEIVEQFYRELP